MHNNSQKVWYDVPVMRAVFALGIFSINYILSIICILLVDLQVASQIATTVAVVRCRPYRHYVFVLK